LVIIFLAIILIFSLERLILITQHSELLQDQGVDWIWNIFYYGWQFDSNIATYVIALPFLVISLMFLFNQSIGKTIKFFRYYFLIFFLVVITMVFIDLPYFAFYNSRLSKGICAG